MLPKFDYLAPETLKETFELLDEHGQDSRILAGGTDLIVNLRARQESARCLVDIKRVKELQQLSLDRNRGLTIGATVTLNKLLHDDAVIHTYPVLAEAAGTIGDFQVRNRATLVGNICNASPAADSAAALLILDAIVNISSKAGTRMVPIKQFFAGVKKTNMTDDEMVTHITIPIPPEKSRGRYLKARRVRGEDLALVGVAGLAYANDNGQRFTRLALVAVAPTPVRALDAERLFERANPSDQLIDDAMPSVIQAISPISDVRASKEYRIHLVKVLTRRLVKELWEAN